jgi:hypothetical protein
MQLVVKDTYVCPLLNAAVLFCLEPRSETLYMCPVLQAALLLLLYYWRCFTAALLLLYLPEPRLRFDVAAIASKIYYWRCFTAALLLLYLPEPRLRFDVEAIASKHTIWNRQPPEQTIFFSELSKFCRTCVRDSSMRYLIYNLYIKQQQIIEP